MCKKLGNLEEMDKFLETYNFLRLNQEDTENLNRLIISNEIELVIKNNFTHTKAKSKGGWLPRRILPNI